ncbi:DNA-processing protein DprA [Psychrobacter sp. FDAARGOS_221]|uniref:DNA-processing protein DprA n=1 Tax=Psychrobacter sp. FDAARGOS_221 TaxID=1975705 RepID=UPI000BB59B64|nr:DNA-processing protein DprA [Psychrobacter sp. FDAARGOS_221]PNK60748.1 DNA-protecting protein DprA [Psychrobacter sp. FDAARGOS_221]
MTTTTKPTDRRVLTPEQQAIVIVWQRVNTSLSAYDKLTRFFGSAHSAKQAAAAEWADIGIHRKHIERHQQATDSADQAFIEQLEQRIANHEFNMVFQDEAGYPQQLLGLFDPPPLLFFRGNLSRLNQPQVAIVGSRKPSQKAQKFTFDMAQYLAQAGFVITSGLAQGVDAQAHLGALAQPVEASGRTVGVMGTGIDVCYPTQHKALFERIVHEGGCIISELFPNTLPHKHTFPRRNRLVAGLSLGTVVTEAAIKSGSLITARLTSEQGKQVFAMPSSIDNANAEGCHHLIREGATLVYHPDQIMVDLCSQLLMPSYPADVQKEGQSSEFQSTASTDTTSSSTTNTAINNTDNPLNTTVATGAKIKPKAQPMLKEAKPAAKHQVTQVDPHLQSLWTHIEFEPQDLDALMNKTQLDTATLLSQLMELELLGAIAQTGGRYQRV